MNVNPEALKAILTETNSSYKEIDDFLKEDQLNKHAFTLAFTRLAIGNRIKSLSNRTKESNQEVQCLQEELDEITQEIRNFEDPEENKLELKDEDTPPKPPQPKTQINPLHQATITAEGIINAFWANNDDEPLEKNMHERNRDDETSFEREKLLYLEHILKATHPDMMPQLEQAANYLKKG